MRPRSRILKVLAGLVSMTILVAVLAHPPASTAQGEDEYAKRIDAVHTLRGEGKYDQAMAELRAMMEEYSNAAEFQRELYKELVETVHLRLKETPDPQARAELESEREALAKETLSHYPDIHANAGFSGVDALYEALRAQMFGTLEIITDPDSCDVMIDGEYLGIVVISFHLLPRHAERRRSINEGGPSSYSQQTNWLSAGRSTHHLLIDNCYL